MNWFSKVITLLLINSFTAVFAQKTQDILILKNGSVLKGSIVSVDTNNGGASIEIAGGSVFVFTKEEIETIKLNGDTIADKKGREGNNRAISKFRSEIGGGGLFGNNNYGYYYTPYATGHFNLSSSYAFNKYFEAGLRVAIFGAYGTNLGIAGVTTFTLDNTKKHVPYLSVASGITKRSGNNYYYYDFASSANNNKPSFWSLAEIGLKTYITSNFGIGYSFGMNYLQFEEKYYDWSGFETTTNYKIARYFLKFSILF